MRKNYGILNLFPFFLLLFSCLPSPRQVTLSREVLMDKIRGGWAGQVIGCTWGGPTEFAYLGRMIPDSVEIPWHEDECLEVFRDRPGLYDDVYMDLTFMEVMLSEGLQAPSSSYARRFAQAPYPLWHANQTARWNILHGIMPPLSGHWTMNPHADDIDFQIESDFIGMITPGMYRTALALADTIGHVMNSGDGWLGGVFVAGMYARAYLGGDVEDVVVSALALLPPQSGYYRTIRDVLDFWRGSPDDWKACWRMVEERHGRDIGCPDGVGRPFNIDARINGAYAVIGLLYGGGDFLRTMDIATRCGQDSDCNPATACGVLGVMLGYSGIPGTYTRAVEKCGQVVFPYTSLTLERVYESTYRLMGEAVLAGGGRMDGQALTIRLQDPQPAGMEQCFPGLEPSEHLPAPPLRDGVAEMTFTGAGYVLSGGIVQNGETEDGYVARVEVTLDEDNPEVLEMPSDFTVRKNEVSMAYGLREGPHRLRVRWLNPSASHDVSLSGLLVYRRRSE